MAQGPIEFVLMKIHQSSGLSNSSRVEYLVHGLSGNRIVEIEQSGSESQINEIKHSIKSLFELISGRVLIFKGDWKTPYILRRLAKHYNLKFNPVDCIDISYLIRVYQSGKKYNGSWELVELSKIVLSIYKLYSPPSLESMVKGHFEVCREIRMSENYMPPLKQFVKEKGFDQIFKNISLSIPKLDDVLDVIEVVQILINHGAQITSKPSLKNTHFIVEEDKEADLRKLKPLSLDYVYSFL